MQKDLNDINSMSQDGTPCIYVCGHNNDRLGVITQSNAGALRTFGYNLHEIKDKNVTKLMPDMYKKHHNAVL